MVRDGMRWGGHCQAAGGPTLMPGTLSDLIQPYPTLSNLIQSYPRDRAFAWVCWGVLGCAGVCWCVLVCAGVCRDGPRWGVLVSAGVRRGLLG